MNIHWVNVEREAGNKCDEGAFPGLERARACGVQKGALIFWGRARVTVTDRVAAADAFTPVSRLAACHTCSVLSFLYRHGFTPLHSPSALFHQVEDLCTQLDVPTCGADADGHTLATNAAILVIKQRYSNLNEGMNFELLP